MKIKNFRIFRYGPLSDTGEFELKNFNILWGKNEKGKTLIVDALLKIMMERGYNSLFDKINRIEGTPEGYVILEYEGKEYKLPQDGYLTEDISAEDFRNIFVIRDSDLSIKYEDDYYNNLTERLTGSKVDIVGSIQRKLLDVGKITDTGRFSNSQRDHKLKSRIDKADDLLKRINALINDLKENNIEEMEIQLISKKREEREISNHLEKLHLVQKKNKLMAGEQLLNDLTEKLNELKNYEKYKEDDLDAWKKYNDDLSKYNKELQKLVNKHNDIIKDQDNVIAEKKALEEKLNKLKKQKELADTLENYINEVNRIEPDYIECDKKLNELENEVNRASQEKKMADYAWNYITKKNIQKRIEDLKNTSWNLEKSQSIRKVFNYIMIFSFVTGITAIAAGAILGSILSIAGGLAFASIGLLLGYVQYRMVKGEKKEDTWEEIINDITPVLEVKPTKSDIEYQLSILEKRKDDAQRDLDIAKQLYNSKKSDCKKLSDNLQTAKDEIMKLVGKLDIPVKENVNLYIGDIERIREEYEKLIKYLSELEGKLKKLQEDRVGLEKDMTDLKSKIQNAKDEISSLMKKYGVESIDELESIIIKKNDVKNEVNKLREKLRTLFDHESGDLDEELDAWKKELKALEQYRDVEVDVEYNQQVENKLKEKLESLQNEIQVLEEKMKEYEEEFRDIERVAKAILECNEPEIILTPLSPDEEIKCNGIGDLNRIQKLLSEFIENNKLRRKYILVARNIFKEIEEEEREKVTEVFGEDSKAIEYFNRITDGLYVNVFYDTETKEIKVERNDGVVLSAAQLSGGAIDQLYFAIRLYLAEKILNEKGFFILDDPFIKADPDRLRRMFDILKELSNKGWQIIYFSSKGEVKDLYDEVYSDAANYVHIELM